MKAWMLTTYALEDEQDDQTRRGALKDWQEHDQMCAAALEDNLEAGDIGGTALEVDQMPRQMDGVQDQSSGWST